MSEELWEPLPTLLDNIAISINKGGFQGAFGAGRRAVWNWPGIMEQHGALVVPYLRKRLEVLSKDRRTVRVAGPKLVPEVVGLLLFTVVVCDVPRPEGEVEQLLPGDWLYVVFAPDALSRGLFAATLEGPRLMGDVNRRVGALDAPRRLTVLEFILRIFWREGVRRAASRPFRHDN